MKISDVVMFVGSHKFFIKVETDAGVFGFGESSPMIPGVLSEIVRTVIKPQVLQQDPFDMETLEARVMRQHYKFSGQLLAAAYSGLEIALWDLKGRYLEQPVYNLLGGRYRLSVPLYGSSMSRHLPPDKEASKVAEAVLRDHFGAVKIKVGPRLGQPGPVDLAQDEAKIRAVQQAVGRTVPLMIDGNGSYSVSEAKMLARRIDDVGIRFFEEPCPYDDIETYVQLASDPTFPPIQVGEQNWNLYTFRDFVSRRACHYYAADPVKCGGLGSAKRAAVLCRAFGVGYTPHNTTKSIGLAAAMHLALSTPECDGWYEYSIESGSDMDLINAKIGHWDGHLQDGKIWIEGKPGLGVDVDEGWLSHHLTVCR